MSDLMPCPFCGSEARWKSGGAVSGHWVSCTQCPAETDDGDKERIRAAWNTRTVQAQIDAAALRRTLHDLITEQSEGEWGDETIAKDVEVFLTAILALISKGDQP